jgi:peptidoglycan LD-endopeptidase LytH
MPTRGRRLRRSSQILATAAIAAIFAGLGWAVYQSPAWRTTIARWLNVTVASPHERYVSMLRASGLDRTALGQDWIAASESSLRQAVAIKLPTDETRVFPNNAAYAVAYRLNLQRGRRLEVHVGPRPYPGHAAGADAADSVEGSARVFVDLFLVDGEGLPTRMASREEDAGVLDYEVTRDGVYLLRVQPELLRGGRFFLTQRTLATLRFPIPGLTARAVQSSFGADRDAGARSHQGVDIFAPKGTATVAVVDGFASPSTNGLGGTVMWLYDPLAGRTFYYAHLDRWAFDAPARVRAGDVIGYVGNTGNARATSPHLHFGIYERGAIDPLPFIRPDDELPDEKSTRAP